MQYLSIFLTSFTSLIEIYGAIGFHHHFIGTLFLLSHPVVYMVSKSNVVRATPPLHLKQAVALGSPLRQVLGV
jgi:hypothetical protein